MIKLFVDFNNADPHGRIRLNTKGTLEDIINAKIVLRNNMKVTLDDSDGLRILGSIEYSMEEKIWVAKINWNEFEEYF
jgi:hypothetical protein